MPWTSLTFPNRKVRDDKQIGYGVSRNCTLWYSVPLTLSRKCFSALFVAVPRAGRMNVWKQIEETRKMAERARRMALTLSSDSDRDRLVTFADELDNRANTLERQASALIPGLARR